MAKLLNAAGPAITDVEAIEAELQSRLSPEGRSPRDRSQWSGREDYYLDHTPPVVCGDGLVFSCQTGSTHYCSPRDWRGPWFAVEIGFPSQRVEAFMPFIDGEDSDPKETVYGYVPITTVAAVIAAHGGLLPLIAHATEGNS